MPGKDQRMGRGGRCLVATFLSLAFLMGGCSAGGMLGGSNAPAAAAPGSGSGGISKFFGGSSAKSAQTVAGATPDVTCPPVEIRQGASALTIAPAGDRSAMSVKYQASFLREARECTLADGNMVMKIGVQGRVIVGPAGGPGQIDIPLRIAVVQETPGGTKPIVTKFIRIPLAVENNPEGTLFSHVEEAMSFPLPTPTAALDDYIVYVGFDPYTAAAEDNEKAKPKPAPKAKPKPKAKPQVKPQATTQAKPKAGAN
jgi:hypothetical protein